jgi:flagellar biosynthesis/type III secretory pathway chaperone
MDKDIIKKFKTIISQQIALQDQLKKMNGDMYNAINTNDINGIRTLTAQIDFAVEQMDSLERNRIDLLSPYIKDKGRLKHINSIIDEFPKDDIPAIKKLHAELKEKAFANFDQTKMNEILLNEAVLDTHKNVEMIAEQINPSIRYGFGGKKQTPLPVHLVNQKI